ncbi:MAG: DUF1697 domain-containing protein [Clostridia bacterium]|nr:DUF1697 domain-containing protein [Clostridia bacterium]
MKRYIALLRGVNVGGKNKISMAELKQGFEAIGLDAVRTHLNSGNVAFSGEEGELSARIQAMIRERFGLDVPVLVISKEWLDDTLKQAPDWWGRGDKEIYDNLILVLPPATAGAVAEKLGEPTEGLEQVCVREGAIFWSFDRKSYAKCSWWKKSASPGIGECITIRTANTVRKLVGM